MTEAIPFLLVPDRAAARRCRRAVASRGARAGILVGTFGELVEQAGRGCLLPPEAVDWDDRLAEAARNEKGAFWSNSLEADPEGTLEVLGRELARLLHALGPGRRLEPVEGSSLSGRGERHLNGLTRLHEAMGRTLPRGLSRIRELLDADAAEALRTFPVHRIEGLPPLGPWQEALLRKLAAGCGCPPDPGLEAILRGELLAPPAGRPRSALRQLQEHLFGGDVPPVPLDPSVSFLAVRDFLEEVEVAAGMAQEAASGKGGIAPAEVGILLPDDPRYEQAAVEVFARAGIPLSGGGAAPDLRNLGGETVFHFLATRRKPAPAMALAALYASPLMPWDPDTGNRLAMEIMGGWFEPDLPGAVSDGARRMAALIRERHDTPKRLREALVEFGALLPEIKPADRHLAEARRALSTLVQDLEKVRGREVPWEELASRIPQAPVPSGGDPEWFCEGAALFREGEEPWRSVRLLFVLGFSEGRYPAGPGRSPLFDDRDLSALASEHGLALETAQEGMVRRRSLFLRQVGAASDRAVFLSPLRDPLGEPVAPCGTAAFAARLFEQVETADALFLTLEREGHRARAVGLPLAPETPPVSPRSPEIRDPELGEDLLSGGGGGSRHETPSSLETLMVSPLSWFLSRHGLLPRAWAPEALDPATKGTLAHTVFERLFAPGKGLPSEATIRSRVPKLLDEAIRRSAPFLLSTEWFVERRNLLREIDTAALRWRRFLAGSKAGVLGVETTLAGSFDGIPVRGRTDLILRLPSGKIFVVDYKKSNSGRRRTCMENGYDIQTSLYRRMLATGRVIGEEASAPAAALKGGAEIGVLYYMMDDQRSLTDRRGWLPGNLPAVESPGEEISGNGEALLLERIADLRAGILRLNRGDDADRFEKVGVSTYALTASPLLERFVHPPADGTEEGE
ncbi:MAG: PD-(D/E)XK nuclease family protein [Deltaproteobacteria bacterium]